MRESIGKNAVVGTKQVLKAMQAGTLAHVYIAEDVEAYITAKLEAAAQEHSIALRTVSTMKELGARVGIDVGAACVGILK